MRIPVVVKYDKFLIFLSYMNGAFTGIAFFLGASLILKLFFDFDILFSIKAPFYLNWPLAVALMLTMALVKGVPSHKKIKREQETPFTYLAAADSGHLVNYVNPNRELEAALFVYKLIATAYAKTGKAFVGNVDQFLGLAKNEGKDPEYALEGFIFLQKMGVVTIDHGFFHPQEPLLKNCVSPRH